MCIYIALYVYTFYLREGVSMIIVVFFIKFFFFFILNILNIEVLHKNVFNVIRTTFVQLF